MRRTWVFFDDANVLDTGDTFTNTGRYNTIDFTNGGDIRGLIRAVEPPRRLHSVQALPIGRYAPLLLRSRSD